MRSEISLCIGTLLVATAQASVIARDKNGENSFSETLGRDLRPVLEIEPRGGDIGVLRTFSKPAPSVEQCTDMIQQIENLLDKAAACGVYYKLKRAENQEPGLASRSGTSGIAGCEILTHICP